MPINFHPKRGTVPMCDYTTGFKAPEMVKRRQVVVVSPRYRRHTGFCIVVPLGTVPLAPRSGQPRPFCTNRLGGSCRSTGQSPR